MTRILKQEVNNCNECYCLRTISRQEKGFEEFCAINNKTINTGFEIIDYIPEWCPLPHKEPTNKYYKGLVYHKQ